MNLFKCSRFILAFTLLLVNIGSVVAQPVVEPPSLTDGSDFRVIQKELNTYFADNPSIKGYKQWKRKEWFLKPRLYPSGQMENLTMKTWKAYDRYMQTTFDSRTSHGSWGFLGPTQCVQGLGRLNTIAFHPSDPDIMYVGASNGGVWKTINEGLSWTNVSPVIPLLAVADIKLSPSNPNVLFLLTGDGDPSPSESNSHGQSEVSSIGVLKSTDAGATWYPTNFSFDHPSIIVPTKLLIHPTNVNIQFVVGHTGIIRTTDQWDTWTTVEEDLVYDIEYNPGNPDIMYAGAENTILKSINGGATWIEVIDADFSEMANASRVEIAIAPNNDNVVYALAGNWSVGLVSLFQSEANGTDNSWTLQTTSAFMLGKFSHYCIALITDPSDWTNLFGGMQWISKSTNEGADWTSIDNNIVHADIHDVAYVNGALWVCCDGGLYKSTNEGSSWTDLSPGLAITEIYRIAGTPQDQNRFFVGCQDNGTMRRDAITSDFDVTLGGDGTVCLIDYTDVDIVYASSQNGSFAKSTSGGDEGSFTNMNVPGDGDWISPILMDQTDHERLFVGKENVYRSDDGGDTWFNLQAPEDMELANCLAQGTSNPQRLYVSSADVIYRVNDALTSNPTWTSIGAGLPDLFISGIAVDPDNSIQVFVSLSGYSDGEKVFRTDNGGDTWIDISGSLPNLPVNCIRFHDNGLGNDALYIGTDIGVFYRDNDIGDWVYFSNGMPVVNINDLFINSEASTITAGTYGRGLWRTGLYSTCVPNFNLTSTSPDSGRRYYSCTNEITSSTTYRKDIGTEIHYSAGHSISLTPDFEAGKYGYFHGKIGPCPGITNEPIMSPYNPSGQLVMDGFKLKTTD